jgi:mycoredoxin
MYSTTWCGFCKNLSKQLAALHIPVQVIDIEQDPAAAAFVEQVNGGNQTVPVIVFPDGQALTNPSAAAVASRLAGN